MFRNILFSVLIGQALLVAGAVTKTIPLPGHITVAVAQTRNKATIAASRDQMLGCIREAAARSARVVVFPEGALTGAAGRGSNEAVEISGAVSALLKAALKYDVYVIFGALTRYAPAFESLPASREEPFQWMMAIDPQGREIFRYDQLSGAAGSVPPRGFEIDGIAAHAMIGADRRLRAVEELPIMDGARLSFELASDPEIAWVPGLNWYAAVARAMRNNVWVVVANAGIPRQGRSAVVAPDGEVVASLDRHEGLLVAAIETSKATRAGAVARRNHGIYGRWWDRAVDDAPALVPRTSPEREVTIAAAQVVLTHDASVLWNAIREAAAKGARLVAFPARTLRSDSPSTLTAVSAAAREAGVYVAVGAGGAAYVFSPTGEQLTRYLPGGNPAKMWFDLDGIPAIVTMGERDGVWTEISELAAVAGAQIRIHLAHDTGAGERENRERRQLGAAMGSYGMLTAVVNAAAPSAAGRSAIWDDLGGVQQPGTVWLSSPSSADLVVEAEHDETILYVTRRVNKVNPHLARIAPPMKGWWERGARIVLP